MQADGREVPTLQLEPAGHPQGADIPRQDRPIQATGVDLAEGSKNTCRHLRGHMAPGIQTLGVTNPPSTMGTMISKCDIPGRG